MYALLICWKKQQQQFKCLTRGKFPASHLSPEPSLALHHLFPTVLPDMLGVLSHCQLCSTCPSWTDRSDSTHRTVGIASQGKGFEMRYQRTESTYSWPWLATSSKPFLLATSQLPCKSKMETTVFPTVYKVHRAEWMKICVKIWLLWAGSRVWEDERKQA